MRSTARIALALCLCAAAVVSCEGVNALTSKDITSAKHPDAQAASPEWKIDEEGLGTWETCDTCEQCILDPLPAGVKPPRPKGGGPGQDPGVVHCKKCLGCSVILTRMKESQPMKALGKDVKVFSGASGAAVMKGVTAERGNVFVKAWCGLNGNYRQTPRNHPLPSKCEHDGENIPSSQRRPCQLKGGIFGWSECNFKFLNALDKLAEDANLTAATPRTWTEHVKSFIPWQKGDEAAGVKVDTRMQFYEVAEGASIEALYGGIIDSRTMALTKKIPHEDVVRAAVFDLLFSEQDRHGQNVFVSETGSLHIIDNEGAFGPINSMLIPGGQKYEVYRIGYNAVCCGNLPGPDEQNCPGEISDASAPEVMVDYRCHAPGRFVGTALPPGLEPFLRRIDKMSEQAVFDHYEMSHLEHAKTLKVRVGEMLDGGFEHAMIAQYARQPPGDGKAYGNDFFYGLQPACCGAKEGDHCKVRVAAHESQNFAQLSEDDKLVWPGNEPGREANTLWPGVVEAPHLKRPMANKLRRVRRLLLGIH